MSGKDVSQELLVARIGVLENQVRFLMKLNGVELSALREASDQDLLSHYQNAAQSIGFSAQDVPLPVIEDWVELFLQLSELEFARLKALVEYDHTWEPFYTLCVKLQTQVRQSKNFAVDPQARELYAALDKARKNIRDAAIIMIRKHPETLPARARVLLQDSLPL